MVRRLPVLQNSAADEVPLSVAQAILVGVGAAVSCWTVLLWALARFGVWGLALSLFLACVAAGSLAGSRATQDDAIRVGVGAWVVVALAVWVVALLGRALPDPRVALAAFCAVGALSGAGFGGGIFAVSWRRRSKRRTRR